MRLDRSKYMSVHASICTSYTAIQVVTLFEKETKWHRRRLRAFSRKLSCLVCFDLLWSYYMKLERTSFAIFLCFKTNCSLDLSHVFFSGTIFENSDCWLGPFHKPETLAASIGNHHAATMKQDARSDTKLCYWHIRCLFSSALSVFVPYCLQFIGVLCLLSLFSTSPSTNLSSLLRIEGELHQNSVFRSGLSSPLRSSYKEDDLQ
jgi:hypothetical protein